MFTPVNSTSFSQPAMNAFASLLVLGTFALQTVLGRPDASRVRGQAEFLKRSVDSFVATESPIAQSRLLCNIGPNGCSDLGASSGVVIASPSENNPDCGSSPPSYSKFHQLREGLQMCILGHETQPSL